MEAEDARREQTRRENLAKTVSALNVLTGGGTIGEVAKPVVAAFYVNWEETAFSSAQKNMASLTHFLPEWLHLHYQGYDFGKANSDKNKPFITSWDNKDKETLVPLARQHNVAILPLLNNYTQKTEAEAGKGAWDTQAVHQLLSDRSARAKFIGILRDWLLKHQ